MRLVICKENLNQEIKGIRIIEIEDMERYLTGGELLLTNMKVYFGETEREFRKHLNELEKKQVSGFIIKQHPDMVQKVNYYDICNYSEPALLKDEIRVTCDRIFDCFVSIVSLFMCRAYVGHDF